MSDRRRARAAAPTATDSGVPPEFTDVSHPVWHDEDLLLARFPDLVDDRVVSRLRMGGRVDQQVMSHWAMSNGYASKQYPGMPDWRALRAAMAAPASTLAKSSAPVETGRD